jgi:hypothetical protein
MEGIAHWCVEDHGTPGAEGRPSKNGQEPMTIGNGASEKRTRERLGGDLADAREGSDERDGVEGREESKREGRDEPAARRLPGG